MTPQGSIAGVKATEAHAVPLDDRSKAIIEQLQQDGRRSFSAIARAVGLSEAAVRQRVTKLLDDDVLKVVAVTNPMQLGFPRQAMVHVKTGADLTGTADRLAEIPEVDYCVVVAGEWDVLVRGVGGDGGAGSEGMGGNGGYGEGGSTSWFGDQAGRGQLAHHVPVEVLGHPDLRPGHQRPRDGDRVPPAGRGDADPFRPGGAIHLLGVQPAGQGVWAGALHGWRGRLL